MLENLQICEHVWKLKNEKNTELFINAIATGHLAGLRCLQVGAGHHFDILLRAFELRLKSTGQQIFLEEFVIDPALQRYGVSEPFVISRMLNLECSSRLKVLDVSSMSDISPYWEGINIIASYIEHTQGAPCLERTRIALRMLPDKFLSRSWRL